MLAWLLHGCWILLTKAVLAFWFMTAYWLAALYLGCYCMEISCLENLWRHFSNCSLREENLHGCFLVSPYKSCVHIAASCSSPVLCLHDCFFVALYQCWVYMTTSWLLLTILVFACMVAFLAALWWCVWMTSSWLLFSVVFKWLLFGHFLTK